MPITVFSPSSMASAAAPSSNFVGPVQLTQLLATAESPSRQHAASVTFAPCATSSWHYHPLGQLIVGMLGLGLVTERGGQPQSIGPGDVVWISPDTEHWHGAQGGGSFSQLAITEGTEDYTTEWLDRATRSSPCSAVEAASSTQWLLLLAVFLAVLIAAWLLRTCWRRRRGSSAHHEASTEAATARGRQEALLAGLASSDAESSHTSPV